MPGATLTSPDRDSEPDNDRGAWSGEDQGFDALWTVNPAGLRPLLQWRRHGGDYRFGWQAGETGIGLEFEWRDGLGKPWGSPGMNRPPACAVARPDPLAGGAGHDRFAFGVVAWSSASRP